MRVSPLRLTRLHGLPNPQIRTSTLVFRVSDGTTGRAREYPVDAVSKLVGPPPPPALPCPRRPPPLILLAASAAAAAAMHGRSASASALLRPVVVVVVVPVFTFAVGSFPSRPLRKKEKERTKTERGRRRRRGSTFRKPSLGATSRTEDCGSEIIL